MAFSCQKCNGTGFCRLTTRSLLMRLTNEASISISFWAISNGYCLDAQILRSSSPPRRSTLKNLHVTSRMRREIRRPLSRSPDEHILLKSGTGPRISNANARTAPWSGLKKIHRRLCVKHVRSSWPPGLGISSVSSPVNAISAKLMTPSRRRNGPVLRSHHSSGAYPTRNSTAFLARTAAVGSYLRPTSLRRR